MTQALGRNASERNNGKSRNESDSGVDKSQQSQQSQQPAHRVRLPGFITDEEIGLGDVVKRTTSYFGVKPCGAANAARRRSTAGWLSPRGGRSKGSREALESGVLGVSFF